MLSIEVGSEVVVSIEEGHCYDEYTLKVNCIDEEGIDDVGNYYCIAFGTGVSEDDKEMEEDYTCRIEPLNFVGVVR